MVGHNFIWRFNQLRRRRERVLAGLLAWQDLLHFLLENQMLALTQGEVLLLFDLVDGDKVRALNFFRWNDVLRLRALRVLAHLGGRLLVVLRLRIHLLRRSHVEDHTAVIFFFLFFFRLLSP